MDDLQKYYGICVSEYLGVENENLPHGLIMYNETTKKSEINARRWNEVYGTPIPTDEALNNQLVKAKNKAKLKTKKNKSIVLEIITDDDLGLGYEEGTLVYHRTNKLMIKIDGAFVAL